MLKFRDEDAEAVMAKALEGGSNSEREQPLLPEPSSVPAPPVTLGEAAKRDGSEVIKTKWRGRPKQEAESFLCR